MLAAVVIQNAIMTVNCQPWKTGGQDEGVFCLSTLRLAFLLLWKKNAGYPRLKRKGGGKRTGKGKILQMCDTEVD